MKLEDIKPNPINPRTMTDAAGDELEASLDEYGDLSGFVFNHDGTIISGHQRWEKIKDRVKAFEVKEQFKTPLPDGTVQRGYFELTDGRRYDYSVRKWPKRKADAATIRANKKNAGEWDKDVLPKWAYSREEMIEYGVDEWVFEGHSANEMSEDELNLLEEFDPVGVAADVQRVVFIFDNKGRAEDWLKENVPDLTVKKMNMAWQVNLSTLFT